MKERFLLTVSWLAFANGVTISVIGVLVALDIQPEQIGLAGEVLEGYADFMDSPVTAIGLSVAIWLVLWIVTGSPRFLPWRR